MAVVAVLEQLEDLEVYIKHPIHVEYVHRVRGFHRIESCAQNFFQWRFCESDIGWTDVIF